MVLDIKISHILEDPDLSSVEIVIVRAVRELALLGESDIARKLASKLLTPGPVCPDHALSYGPLSKKLNFAWEASGEWPEGIPESDKEEKSFRELEQLAESEWGLYVKDERRLTYDEDGLAACLEETYNDKGDTKDYPSDLQAQRLVKALDISIRLHPVRGPDTDSLGRTAKRAKGAGGKPVESGNIEDELKVADLDKTSADIVKQIASKWEDYQLTKLEEIRSLWPLFLRGVFRDALNVSREEVQSKGKAIRKAFSQRLEHPAGQSELSSMSMKELLELADKNTCKGPGTDYFAEAGDDLPETMFQKPTSDKVITNMERRLKVTLPDDYKEFLCTSNGFFANKDMDDGIYNGYFPDPALHPAAEVKWVRESYFALPAELIELPRHIEELVPSVKKTAPGDHSLEWDTPFPLFGRVLDIGNRDIDSLWLIPPELVKESRKVYLQIYEAADEKQKLVVKRAIDNFAGSLENFRKLDWCCVKWSSGGSACMRAHSSFRRYLESVTWDSQETK